MARLKQIAGPHIFWRNGRAYADLRTYEDVGGKREALAPPHSTWGTNDPQIALLPFESRLAQLPAINQGYASRNALRGRLPSYT